MARLMGWDWVNRARMGLGRMDGYTEFLFSSSHKIKIGIGGRGKSIVN